MSQSQLIAVLRLGRVQAVLKTHGEGPLQARPVVNIHKVLDDETRERDPGAQERFEMEEIVALRTLLDHVIDQALGIQTLVPKQVRAEEPEPCADCGSTETHPVVTTSEDGQSKNICEIYRTAKPEIQE